jgi:hypothetical protein
VEFEGLTAIPHATDGDLVAYTSLRATGIKEARDDRPGAQVLLLIGQGSPEPPPVVTPDGPDRLTRVPPGDGSAADVVPVLQNGPRLPVSMADVFPEGCYLVPASIGETYDYDEKAKTCRPAVDEITGQPVFQCQVVDMDPEQRGRSRKTEVKIVAEQMPVPPTPAPYGPVEFEGLTAIPHATDGDLVAYTSLRATGIKEAVPGSQVA